MWNCAGKTGALIANSSNQVARMSQIKNLLQDLPKARSEEIVEVLAESKSIRIERIVSTGQHSPSGFWYDQPEDEFVVLLSGTADLLFEGQETPTRLQAGDSINITAHRKHRVESTSPNEPRVWLAIFYE